MALAVGQGLSVGLGFFYSRNSEEEFRQGKSYYTSSLCQVSQISLLAEVVLKVVETVTKVSRAVFITFQAIPWALIPLALLTAATTLGQLRCIKALPKALGRAITQISFFFTEHAGDIARVAMVVAGVATLVFGHYFFGAALITMLIFREIHARGYLPEKVNLFIEKYLPIVSGIGLLLTSVTPFNQIIAVLSIAGYLFSHISQWATHALEKGVGFISCRPGPSLKEYESPLVLPSLTHEQILNTLNGEDGQYEINPAHCSKWAVDEKILPRSTEFKNFLTIYDDLIPNISYSLLLSKLKDDDIFLDLLRKEFPNTNFEKPDSTTQSPEEIKERRIALAQSFEECIETLATRKNKTKKQYLKDWTRAQLDICVAVLLGNRAPKGGYSDLEAARIQFSYILSYLESTQDLQEKENLILNIAIDGGDYCARGLLRASNNLFNQCLAAIGNSLGNLTKATPNQIYEMRLLHALENLRNTLFEEVYEGLIKPTIPKSLSQDIHTYSLMRSKMMRGFYPHTKTEQQDESITDIMSWRILSSTRQKMLFKYREKLDDAIEELKRDPFTDYLRSRIHNNPQLTADQKEHILEIFTECNEKKWGIETTHHRFNRLVLVMLGVLRQRAA